MSSDPRIEKIVNLLVAYASGDLGARLEPSDKADDVDAIIEGINMLGEELSSSTVMEEHWRTQAHHDALTGVPNRMLFTDRLRMALARLNRVGSKVALFFVDLDGFKEINDRHGHEGGDQLLRQVAGRLVGCVRKNETVSRFGGDEFTVLMELFHSNEDVELVAQRILRSLIPPIDLGSESVSLTASVGIALALRGKRDYRDLIREADEAMYMAKQRGPGRYCFYRETGS